MIKESYVSFDTARMLKEAGFEANLKTRYVEEEKGEWAFWDSGTKRSDYNYFDDTIACPTQSLAARWLRDVYNLHISTEPYAGTWHWVLWNVNGTFITNSATRGKEDFETCEEAIEDALQEVIKLVK